MLLPPSAWPFPSSLYFFPSTFWRGNRQRGSFHPSIQHFNPYSPIVSGRPHKSCISKELGLKACMLDDYWKGKAANLDIFSLTHTSGFLGAVIRATFQDRRFEFIRERNPCISVAYRYEEVPTYPTSPLPNPRWPVWVLIRGFAEPLPLSTP